MSASIKLGNIWGIPIGLHISWFLIFALLIWSLSTGYFPGEYPRLSSIVYLLMAVATSPLFFASVLAHELGHSFFALRNQIPVKSITLFIFGGVAQISQEPRSPGAEFRIAIAGPLTSLTLGLLFGGLWLLVRSIPYLAAPSQYLMRINLILGVFNLIPGFPLDGGRVLRALAWGLTKNYYRSTQMAALAGEIVAFGFIAFGIFTIFSGQFMNGLWLSFIGWFLQNAAASTYSQTNMQHLLQGVTVAQAMTSDCQQIPGLETLNQLVEERVLTGGKRCFFVTEEGQLQGMLSLRDITEVPKPKWRYTTVQQVMTPTSRLVQVTPETKLLDALSVMADSNVAQVPVIESGNLLGVLSREQIVQYVRLRAKLGI
jgi:Zn-dependent protease